MELLQVRLEPSRPVGRLLGVRSPQHSEDSLQALGVNHVAHTDEIGVARRNPDDQVGLADDAQDQIELVFSLDGAGFDVFDDSGAVIRVHDGFADSESHSSLTPFPASIISRRSPYQQHHT